MLRRPVPHLAVLGTSDGTCLWEGGLGRADRAGLPMEPLRPAPHPERMAGHRGAQRLRARADVEV